MSQKTKAEQDYIDGSVVFDNGRMFQSGDSPELKAGWFTAKCQKEAGLPVQYLVIDASELAQMRQMIQTQSERLSEADLVIMKMRDLLTAKLKEWQVYSNSSSLVETTKALLHKMQYNVERNYHNAFAFRDNVIAEMRAMILVARSCESAATHREKDARIRGLIDVISAGIDTLSRVSDLWYKEVYWGDGLLRSDSSLPWLQRENWQLQKTIDRYAGKYGLLPAEGSADEQGGPDVDGVPF